MLYFVVVGALSVLFLVGAALLARSAEVCGFVSGFALSRLQRVTGSAAAAAIAMEGLLKYDTVITSFPSRRGRLALRVVRAALRRLVTITAREYGVSQERAEATVVHVLGVWGSGVVDINQDPIADFLGKS